MKRPLVVLFGIALLLFSCKNEKGEEEKNINEVAFSDADMVILNKTLNLTSTLDNYTNLSLPDHYLSDEAMVADNTPEENPVTDMGATLGRVLFYDKNLSANNTISCASCHQQSTAFSDTNRFSKGLNGELTGRNSMTLVNSRYYENGKFFWDERATTLEEQVLMPIQDHIEMGMDLGDLETKLQQLDYYQLLFKKAFGTEKVTSDRISKALSQFIRSIVSFDSRFDEALSAEGSPAVDEKMPELSAFTAQEKLGMDIFLKGRNGATCGYCHGTAQMVNDEAKNNGLSLNYTDQGKGKVSGKSSDNALFKVPSLRNIALTAPYMHDGRFKTLKEVMDHYSEGVQDHPNLNFRLTTLDDGEVGVTEVLKLHLSQAEKEAVIAFLHTLTDESLLTDSKYSDPFK